jgi:hypothetical protein
LLGSIRTLEALKRRFANERKVAQLVSSQMRFQPQPQGDRRTGQAHCVATGKALQLGQLSLLGHAARVNSVAMPWRAREKVKCAQLTPQNPSPSLHCMMNAPLLCPKSRWNRHEHDYFWLWNPSHKYL